MSTPTNAPTTTDTLARLARALADRYEVQGELGAGGMATVYSAVDRKHQRDVAIKVLHSDLGLALGGERFLSEIRTTARLQHPHILPLLDSGEGDGLLYYVMPLVAGETLRARLEREGQLPVDVAVAIAREVADALQYAHALGVIHRDIKPENILLRDGHAVVADFGIALAVQTAGGARMTQTGLSLGTPQYMSPEQAMGERTIDARSDVYALGAVTYEMLAGEPPFTGPSVQAIVARLIAEEPRPLAAQRRAVPPGVEHAVMRALEKLPADRFAGAAEFGAALLAEAPRTGRRAAPAAATSSPPRWALGVAAVVLLAAGAGMARAFFMPAPAREPLRKLAIALPDSMRVAFNGNRELPGGQGSVTISGDGRRIAWVGVATAGAIGGEVRLYVRDTDSFVISPVPGSAGAFAPFLSGDATRLGYFSGQELREVMLANGETRVLARAIDLPSGATYLPDGSVLVVNDDGELTRIAPGGSTQRITLSSTSGSVATSALSFPSAVAGGGQAVGVLRGGALVVLSLADGIVRQIHPFAAADSARGIVGSAPKVAGGRLYWVERDVVMSAAFDGEKGRLTSEPAAVVDGARGDLLGAADFDVADDGTVVFVAGADPAVGPLAWIDRQGRVDTLALPPADYAGFDISPDGRSLVTKRMTSAGGAEIRVHDIVGGAGSLLDVGTGDISQPGWDAGGRAILVSAAPQGVASARVLRVATGGRSRADTLLPGGLDRLAVARDGGVVIVQVSRTQSANRYLSGRDATMIFASRDGAPFEELAPLRNMVSPAVSPDGRWVTYEKYGAGQTELFIERFPLDGRPVRVPTDGGSEALFSTKGDKLFYRVGRRIMEVPLVFQGDRVSFGAPTPYVTFDFADFLGRSYKVGSDDRILVKLLPSTTPQPEIRVVTGGR